MRASTQRLLSIFIALALFGTAAYFLFNVDFPRWQRIQALRGEIGEREAVRDQLADIVAKAQELLARFEDLDRKAQPITAALPAQPELPEVLAIFSALASKNNLTLSQVTFEDVLGRLSIGETSSQAAEIKVSVGMVGRYADIKNWLKTLETELRLMDSTKVAIQPVVAKPGEDLFALTATLKVYYQPKPEAILPKPEVITPLTKTQ